MATKDSRFAQIYRQELAKSKGLMGAFASTGAERAKEMFDLRRFLLPQSGVSGAIAQQVFGKSYRYGSRKDNVRNVSATNSTPAKVTSDRLLPIEINSKITAKNSMVLPDMARDMNLMRLNVQKMVRLSGGKASIKSDMFFKRSAERESLYESTFKKEGSSVGGIGGAVGGAASAAGGILGSAAKLLGGIGGGLFSIGSSIIGGLVGILGSTAGAIFKVIGGGLAMLGPIGIVFSGLAAFLIYQIASSINFEKLGKDFNNLYNDIVKGIKDFFGIKDDENAPSIVEQFGRKLDNFFGTTKFTDTLDFIEDTYEDIKISLIAHSTSAWESIKDIFKAIGHDIVALVNHHYAEYRTFLGMAGGAYAGGLFFGPKGAIAGAAAGAIGAAVTKTIPNATTEELQKELASQRAKLTMEGPGGEGYRKNPNKPSPATVIADRARPISQWITDIEAELRKRPGSSTRTGDTISNLRTDYGQRVDRELERMQDDAIERRNLRRERRAAETRNTSPNTPSAVDQGREGRDRGISPSGNTGAIRLNASQREMADLIYSKFSAAGFTPDQANAAVVNALAESSLNPRAEAVTSRESSYGLFQMNTRGGLGTGHDPEKLKDPNYNIDLMINAARSNAGNRFRQSRDLETAIRTFTEDLERPANKVEKGIERVALAGKIGLTSGNSPSLAQNPNTPPSAPEAESSSMLAEIGSMMSVVFAMIGDTNKSVQQVAAISARPTEQTSSGPIPSPYDSQLFESLLRHHSELGSSILES